MELNLIIFEYHSIDLCYKQWSFGYCSKASKRKKY